MASAQGMRIRDLRVSAGLSQQELAGADLSASYVSLIEAGTRRPSARTLGILASRLGRSAEFLRTGVDLDQGQELELDVRYAELSLSSGDYPEAERRFRLILTRTHSGPTKLRAEWGLARALESEGKLAAAIATYERILIESESSPSVVSPLRCAVALSRCYREAGDLAHAVDVATQTMARAELLGLSGSDAEIELISTLAFAHLERGDLHRAHYLLEHALDLVENGGTRRSRGAALWNVSLLAYERGDLAVAVELAERALALFAEADDDRSTARLRNVLGGLLIRGDPAELIRGMGLLRAARESLELTGSTVDVGYCDTEIARGHLLLGEAREALEVASRALTAIREDTLEKSRALLVCAAAWSQLGDAEAAAESRRMAGTSLQEAGASRQAAAAWAELAAQCEGLDDHAGALDAYRHLARSLGVPTVSASLPNSMSGGLSRTATG